MPSRARHAKATPSPLSKIIFLAFALSVLIVIGPALIGLGLVFGIVWAWMGKGLTKS